VPSGIKSSRAKRLRKAWRGWLEFGPNELARRCTVPAGAPDGAALACDGPQSYSFPMTEGQEAGSSRSSRRPSVSGRLPALVIGIISTVLGVSLALANVEAVAVAIILVLGLICILFGLGVVRSEAQVRRQPGDSGKKITRVVGWSFLALAVVALMALLWEWPTIAGSPSATSCTFPYMPKQDKGSPATPAKPAKLVLINGQTTTLPFSRAQITKTLTIQYGINGIFRQSATYPNLRVDQLDFLRDDELALPTGRVKVAAWYKDGRVLLKLCVNRSGSKLADPGIYQGTVRIVDPRVAPVDAQLTVTLAYPTWERVLGLLVLAILGGTWYIWVLKQKKPGDPAIGSQFWTWCISMIGVLSIGAGTVAAVAVFDATYLRSDSWGSSAEQSIALLGAMFTAFVTVAISVHIGAAAGQDQIERENKDH
jgi:hypothetical protein